MRDIETDRFILKLVEDKYIKEIYKILSNNKVIKNLNMDIHKSINDTKSLLDDYYNGYNAGTKYPYEILDRKTNKFLGIFLIKLDLYDEDSYEFTIYIDEDYWGKGIYSEILPYMVEVAFEDIKTSNFRGFVMDKNNISKHVLEKFFKLEKIFDVPGIDAKIYSYLLTKDDYYDNRV